MTIARKTQPRRRGYLFFEMILLLALIGIFALVAGKLLFTTMNAMAQTQRREETARRFDVATNLMRADVWSAQLIEADGPSATLHEPDGQTIVWRAESEPADDGSGAPSPSGPFIRLTRSAQRRSAGPSETTPATMPAADVTQWEPLPAGITFAADGPTLTMHVPSTDDRLGNDARSAITMVSQLQLLAGRKP